MEDADNLEFQRIHRIGKRSSPTLNLRGIHSFDKRKALFHWLAKEKSGALSICMDKSVRMFPQMEQNNSRTRFHHYGKTGCTGGKSNGTVLSTGSFGKQTA